MAVAEAGNEVLIILQNLEKHSINMASGNNAKSEEIGFLLFTYS